MWPYLNKRRSLALLVTLFVAINIPTFQANAEAVNRAWFKYISGLNLQKFQAHCAPQHFVPPPEIPSIGKILLVHGFTACPQQFFEWSEMLTHSGFEVYLFTLPGEGYKKKTDGTDDYENLPDHGFIRPYQELAQMMVEVASGDPLPSSVGGISVGGAVALNAALLAQNPFEKVLLMTPFLETANQWARRLLTPLDILPHFRDYKWGWDKISCPEELRRGRAGICNFTVSQISTTQRYGRFLENLSRQEVYRNRINRSLLQVIGVENDPAAGNGAIHRLVRNLSDSDHSPRMRFCVFREGVNHSLLSRFDSPDQNKYWLDGLLKNATLFQTQGQWIPTEGYSAVESGVPLCQ